jgi:TolA-binding protein
VLAGAKEFIGRDFRDRVFLAHNPFGPQSRIACVYTGYFLAPKAGAYTFACSSQDSSFLLVDDKEVIDNGGFHRPQYDVSRQGKIELQGGPHKLTFYHVCSGGDPVAVAAWQTPDAKDIKPMPVEAFSPVVRATPGAIQRYGREVEIDFIPQYEGEAFVADRYFQRYSFEALTVGNPGASVQWQWDFGDAQKSTAAKAEHVWLVNGEYTVTLTAKTYAGVLTRTNRLFVSRPWDRLTENKLDGVHQQAGIVLGYDFKGLGADATCEAIVLLNRAAAKDATREALLKAGEALTLKDSAAGKLLAEAMPIYAEALVASGDAPKAVAALGKAAKMTADPAVAADLLVRAGNILLDKDEPAKACEVFEGAIRQYARLTTSPAIRSARIGVGDSWRLRGDYDKAKAAYTDARVRLDAANQPAAVLRGDLAHHVEDYVRQKSLEAARQYLDRWEDSFPLDRLEGYLSLMKARYLAARGADAEAAREAEVLVGVNPTSSYAADLLMLAAAAYDKLKKPDQAKAALKMIVEKYPESPLSVVAAQKLKKAG